MDAAGEILSYVDSLVERFEPLRVVLFGSYAYGHPTSDSDVDLLVVMPHPGVSSHRLAARMRVTLEMTSFPMDLLIRSPSEVSRRLEMGDCFMEEIIEKGVVLYESNHPRVGRQGRSRLQRRLGALEVA